MTQNLIDGDLKDELYAPSHRSYSPTLGRWLQQDPNPAGQYNDGMNLYQMEGSDPITNLDASGLDTIDDFEKKVHQIVDDKTWDDIPLIKDILNAVNKDSTDQVEKIKEGLKDATKRKEFLDSINCDKKNGQNKGSS